MAIWKLLAGIFAGLCCLPLHAAEPLLLGKGVHPLVDRRMVESLTGTRHVLQTPVRREVVLTMDRPWEGKMSGYGSVMRDEEGRIRLYYRGGGDIDPPEVTCVAFSRDGVQFERPVLGLYKIRGTRDNNVVCTADKPSYGESHNFAPFLDTKQGVPAEQRWKAVALRRDTDDSGERRRMLTVLGSPDGLNWKPLADRPVIRTGSFDSLNIAFYDEARGEYACYYRVGVDGRRSFARVHSSDFLTWSFEDPLVFRPTQDEQWYTNGVVRYPGVPGLYLSLPMRFVPERKSIGDPPRTTDGLSDAVLMSSRDGRTWDRTFREALIRPGLDAMNWGDAHGNNTPLAGIVETGAAEWSLYWFEGGVTGTPRIRRGTVRPHGFASLHAGADQGEFTTPLLRLQDTSQTPAGVALNVSTSAVGAIQVEVQDEQGRPIPGFAAGDCGEIYGDDLARAVSWSGGRELPHGKAFRLRFVMRDADLFALQIR